MTTHDDGGGDGEFEMADLNETDWRFGVDHDLNHDQIGKMEAVFFHRCVQ